MATLDSRGMLTLKDHAKMLAPGGVVSHVVDLMSQKSPAIRDAVFRMGNLPTGHRIVARTGLPSAYFRRYNEGFRMSKGRYDQFDETCGQLAVRTAVDVDLAELDGIDAARAREAEGVVEAFTQGAERGLWYESTATGAHKFTGLTPRLNDLGSDFASQIVVHTETPAGNNNTSMWFVVWGDRTVYGIFPKGSTAGLNPHNRGIIDVPDRDGRPVPSYVVDWRWKLGFAVEDYRYLVRIANIDLSTLSGADDTLIPAMIRAYTRLQDTTSGRPVIYCNRVVWEYLWLQSRTFAKAQITVGEEEGRPKMRFMGIPIEITDGLLATEAPLIGG